MPIGDGGGAYYAFVLLLAPHGLLDLPTILGVMTASLALNKPQETNKKHLFFLYKGCIELSDYVCFEVSLNSRNYSVSGIFFMLRIIRTIDSFKSFSNSLLQCMHYSSTNQKTTRSTGPNKFLFFSICTLSDFTDET
jgi:hypothetical protein